MTADFTVATPARAVDAFPAACPHCPELLAPGHSDASMSWLFVQVGWLLHEEVR
jgi:hypothetical protein